jgi:hypothetical protein
MVLLTTNGNAETPAAASSSIRMIALTLTAGATGTAAARSMMDNEPAVLYDRAHSKKTITMQEKVCFDRYSTFVCMYILPRQLTAKGSLLSARSRRLLLSVIV